MAFKFKDKGTQSIVSIFFYDAAIIALGPKLELKSL